ncbi:MAG TPA: Ran-binding zinc finger domain-containing protein, partial [Gemmatimonadaceae bacterium]|nr:Ran-binding zinc finger domain-containing protein [Gemmatimonadaceae bacterium]
LRGVIDQLRDHRSSVQTLVASMEERLNVLESTESRHQDDRAEAELRAAIGELEPERCQAIVQAAEDEIARIVAERTSVEPELSRMRDILASTADQPAVAEAQPAAAAAPAVAQPAPAPAPAAPRAPARPQEAGGFDELEFLKSVALESRTKTPDAPAPAVAPEPAHAAAAGAARESASASNGARMSGSVPAFLRDVPSEQTKTLKCQECGTMNYPTEWYCERCGAELAAL